MNVPRKRVLTVAMFCDDYGVGKSTVYSEIASSRLKSFQVGRKRLIAIDDAEAWLARYRQPEPLAA